MARTLSEPFLALGDELAVENAAAVHRWARLPSRHTARRHHDDHAADHAPTLAIIFVDVSLDISHHQPPAEPLAVEANERFERCRCASPHDGSPSAEAERSA